MTCSCTKCDWEGDEDHTIGATRMSPGACPICGEACRVSPEPFEGFSASTKGRTLDDHLAELRSGRSEAQFMAGRN